MGRITIDDYYSLAKEYGWEWTEKEKPPRSHDKSLWRCPDGHDVSISYSLLKNRLKKGFGGCAHCVGLAPLTEQDYHNAAQKRDGWWVSDRLPSNNKDKTEWRCQCGYEWSQSYHAIANSNHWCPKCAGNLPRTAEDYHELADERGILWIGTEVPPNVQTKTKWLCHCGNLWLTNYMNVRFGAYNCTTCKFVLVGENGKVPYDKYHEVANSRGYKIVDLPEGTRVKNYIVLRCPNGHLWRTTFGHFHNHQQNCPECQNIINGVYASEPQLQIARMVNGIVNHPVGHYFADVAIWASGHPIAIEYDCWYWHKDRLDQDAIRDDYFCEQGWRVLRIRTKEAIPSEGVLWEAIEELVNGDVMWAEIVLEGWGD